MSFLSSMDISASGMTAQRLRLDVASENIANMETTRTESGGSYKRKTVILESAESGSFRKALQKAAGVVATAVADEEAGFEPVYNPDHPDADENGYVQMPNISLIKETVDSMSATRSYEANITAFNAMKTMAQKALEIGK
ncbi:flagellar basal body rod protein FlgC [Parasporobacterium paucivorans]|uniref:Flagellar basal-body rod protein FlgC n=1 Tax=Parasporobacterium paucivorans DSM 15970 TaxID=1122934 RepID=A0A1M6I8Z4_9FIRM|nr:flagellar basal body rod protein FlgC [Parasporobacterium paucivorans]SHJ30941.1 flagellar basal-body rod protein FlgC [Parasporobacterium paucivorans DSM 15970]